MGINAQHPTTLRTSIRSKRIVTQTKNVPTQGWLPLTITIVPTQEWHLQAQPGEDSAPAKPKRKRIVMRKPVVAVERVTPRNDQDDNK